MSSGFGILLLFLKLFSVFLQALIELTSISFMMVVFYKNIIYYIVHQILKTNRQNTENPKQMTIRTKVQPLNIDKCNIIHPCIFHRHFWFLQYIIISILNTNILTSLPVYKQCITAYTVTCSWRILTVFSIASKTQQTWLSDM